MCRVCLKRPAVAEERFGRCEACAKGGRTVSRFRLVPGRDSALVVRAGELSPRALRNKLREQLQNYTGHPTVKAHLGLHEVELVLSKDHLETIRVAADLVDRQDAVVQALRNAAERTDAAW